MYNDKKKEKMRSRYEACDELHHELCFIDSIKAVKREPALKARNENNFPFYDLTTIDF